VAQLSEEGTPYHTPTRLLGMLLSLECGAFRPWLLGAGLVFSSGAVADGPDVAIRVGDGSAVQRSGPNGRNREGGTVNFIHRIYCRSGRWRAELSQLLPWATADIPLRGATVLELGSGPGLTTDWLRPRVGALATVEYDKSDAEALRRRLPDVDVHHGDATALPFSDATFDGVVCFTMLHHVPTRELQDRLFKEARRVLRPGGVFAGSDSRWGPLFALAHLGDTLLLVDPAGLPERLRAAGFVDATADLRRSAFRFRAVASE
jgi:SAM-dependent methyltransferase